MEKDNSIRREIVASQIKDALDRRGMTRKQFADEMNRTPSEVTRWLSGNHNFTIDLLSEISDALGEQITGVIASCKTDGSVTDCYGGSLSDPRENAYGGECNVGQIILPADCYSRLQSRANQKGEDINAYVKEILIMEAARPKFKASDFCGIWSDEDFGMTAEELISDIRSHRSAHREIEEL